MIHLFVFLFACLSLCFPMFASMNVFVKRPLWEIVAPITLMAPGED